VGHASRPRLHDAFGLDAQSRRICLPTARRCESNTNPNGIAKRYTYGNSNCYSNGNSNGNSNCDSNSYAYTHSYANGHSNSYAYTDSYANGHSNGDAYADSDYSDAQTTSDAAASSVELSGFVREGTRERKLASPTPEVDRLL